MRLLEGLDYGCLWLLGQWFYFCGKWFRLQKKFERFYEENKLGLLGVHRRPTRRVCWWFSRAAIVGLIFSSWRKKVLDCSRIGKIVYSWLLDKVLGVCGGRWAFKLLRLNVSRWWKSSVDKWGKIRWVRWICTKSELWSGVRES